MLLGVDRSSHKSTALSVTKALHALGVRFAIDRASVGTKPDTAFATNRQRARDAGWQVGAFAFLYGRKLVDPRAQARLFVDRLGATGGVDGVIKAVDMEWVADPQHAPHPDDGKAFAAEFRTLLPGHPLVLYTARGYLASMWPDAADTFDLVWDAYWRKGITPDTLPPTTYFGRYSGFGPSPLGQWGPFHVGKVIYDGDAWYGTRDELAALGGTVSPDYAYPVDCSIGQWRGLTYPGHLRWAVDVNFGTGNDDFGKPVLASAPGTVAVIRPDYGDVWVNHIGGHTTKYGHMQVKPNGLMDVRVGQKVAQGERLGRIGRTHPHKQIFAHLHVEHAVNGKAVRVSYHRKPFPASLNPARDATAPLCRPSPTPVPHPGGPMQLADISERGHIATLKPTAVIEDAGEQPIQGATPVAPIEVIGRTPGKRIAILVKVGTTIREAYVKPEGVAGVVAPDETAAVKAGRQALKDQIAGIPA